MTGISLAVRKVLMPLYSSARPLMQNFCISALSLPPVTHYFILDQHCPCTSLGTHLVKKPCGMEENLVQFLGWEDPLEEDMTTPSSLLAWRIPVDRGAWRAAVRGVTESQTGLSDYAQHGVVLSCCTVWVPLHTHHAASPEQIDCSQLPCPAHLCQSSRLRKPGLCAL